MGVVSWIAMTMSPDVALAYLATLSVDIRRAAITTADGQLLAGDPEVVVRGVRHVADDQHAIHVDAGPHALAAVLEFDLRSILGDLRNR
jgi:hypothetical protein